MKQDEIRNEVTGGLHIPVRNACTGDCFHSQQLVGKLLCDVQMKRRKCRHKETNSWAIDKGE